MHRRLTQPSTGSHRESGSTYFIPLRSSPLETCCLTRAVVRAAFFNSQPTKRGVSVFLLKQVIHDWSDEYCVKFLTQLRAAAQPNTKLIISTASSPSPAATQAQSLVRPPAPLLLANYGAVDEMAYNADIAVH
ncbi:hypothetical protein D9615_002144 [Tricholomella constricta]|uniref:O-methyltransferase C-terminal domain-containing protein n=1 Tax=Tricholomella constricta TaxID=117010 RepID=A0A8H5HNY9_9AGAR|nr:hypothetical protein D9615_002144 [Tricholomella constricta]